MVTSWRLRSCQKHCSRCLLYQHQRFQQKDSPFWDATRFKLRSASLFETLKPCLQHLRRELHWRRLLNSGAQNQRICTIFTKTSSRVSKIAAIQSCKISNSFHEQAIEDCLEFIKKTSTSADADIANAYTGAPESWGLKVHDKMLRIQEFILLPSWPHMTCPLIMFKENIT